MWEDPTDAENSKPSDSQGLSHPRKYSLHPQQKIDPQSTPWNTAFSALIEEINPELSAKPVVNFFEGDAKQNNTVVPRGPESCL